MVWIFFYFFFENFFIFGKLFYFFKKFFIFFFEKVFWKRILRVFLADINKEKRRYYDRIMPVF